MPDTFQLSNWSYGALVVLVLVCAIFGGIGYAIASRRVKQPLLAFFLRFAVVFLLLVVIEAAILSLWPSVHEAISNFTTTLVGGMLSTVGVPESVSGSIITLQDPFLVFSVDAACLGGLLFWAYIALVLAESRASAKQRIAGLFIGSAILLGFNFFRITFSIYLEWLTEVHVHDYFYIVNMIVVLIVWAGWLRITKPGTTSVAKPSPPQTFVSDSQNE
jgi:exosortase/archaeosortase family protein